MQVPKRRSDKLRKYDNSPIYLTKAGFEKLKRTIIRLERELPDTIKEVARTKEYGDFSENAEYKEAKYRMRKIHSRLFHINEKLKRAELINEDVNITGYVQIGSTVTLELSDKLYNFQILGSYESDPSKGRISYTSPLGSSLLNHKVGDEVEVDVRGKKVIYGIVEIK